MDEDEREVSFSPEASEVRRRALSELRDEMDQHVSALLATARDHLTRPVEAGADAPTEIRVEIGVGPHRTTAPQHPTDEGETFTSCSTVSEPCGKSETGYIYCNLTYCVTVGPIVIEH